MPKPRHPAADDDQAGVEEGHQAGEHPADALAAVADHLNGVRVALGDGTGNINGGQLTLLREHGSQYGRPLTARRGECVARECGSAEERLQAAGVAARAGRSELLHADVADVAGASIDAAVQLAVDDDSAPDAGADLDEQEVAGRLATPECCSPRAITLTSLSSSTGHPSSRAMASRTG